MAFLSFFKKIYFESVSSLNSILVLHCYFVRVRFIFKFSLRLSCFIIFIRQALIPAYKAAGRLLEGLYIAVAGLCMQKGPASVSAFSSLRFAGGRL